MCRCMQVSLPTPKQYNDYTMCRRMQVILPTPKHYHILCSDVFKSVYQHLNNVIYHTPTYVIYYEQTYASQN